MQRVEAEIEAGYLDRVFRAVWQQVRLDVAAGYQPTLAWLRSPAYEESAIVHALTVTGLDPDVLRDALIRTVGRSGAGVASWLWE